MLVEVYGNTAPTDKLCREWFRHFKDGDFSVEDKPRSEQPKKFEEKELEALMLISLDVVSLFTNIPIDLASDNVVRRWDSISKKTKILLDEFLIAFRIVLNSTVFIFNKKMYKYFHLCHPKFQQNNLIVLINIFLQNGYPLHFIFSTIHNSIKYHINNINSLNNNKDDTERSFTIPKQLKTRLHEHVSDINISSKSINHNFKCDKVNMLESSYNKRLISEMIYIKKQKYGINRQNDTESLPELYSNIIHSLSPS
ncbi:MOS1T transposase, partial [Pseudoatta argentina]